jgi:hypothetical protein
MADFVTPFAQGGPRRSPTSSEKTNGFPCGPADQELFNGLFYRLEAELGGLVNLSGFTGSDADLQQVPRAVRSQKLNYFSAGGTADALTITPNPAFADLSQLVGVPLRIFSASANTGAMTLNVNSLGAKPIVWPDGTAMAAGDIGASEMFEVLYGGTNFIRLGMSPARIRAMIAAARSASRKVRLYYANDVWTKPAGLLYAAVKLIGSGAGGGKSTSTTTTPKNGGGGGNGGYAEDIFAAAELPASVPVTVPAGGAGATGTSPANGSNGASTAFGALLAASGGLAGSGASDNYGTGGTGGAGAANGRLSQIVMTGLRGSDGFLLAGGTYPTRFDGLGRGGQGGFYTIPNATGLDGGTGGSGLVIVEEYY